MGDIEVSALGDVATKTVLASKRSFNHALSVVKTNADSFIEMVHKISEPPDEVQVTFGLVVTAEGNVAIAKAGAAAGYAVTMIWRNDGKSSEVNQPDMMPQAGETV